MADNLGLPEGFVLDTDLPEGFILDEPVTEQPVERGGWDEALPAAQAGFANMATFGLWDEGKAALQAAARSGFKGDVDYNTAYEHFLNKQRGTQEYLQERNPYSYGTGQVAGAIAPALTGAGLAPAAAKGLASAQAAGFIPSALTSAGLGGVSAGLYGAGSGEGGFDRIDKALEYAKWGLGGGAAGTAVANLGGRLIGKYFAKKAPTLTKGVKDVVKTDTTKGELLDLTAGQATQQAPLQSLEKAALKGGVGEAAQQKALQAQSIQQSQIRGALEEFEPADAPLGEAAKMVKQSFKSIKAKVNKAYEDARIIQQVYVNKTPIDEVFKPQVKALMRQGGHSLEDFTPKAKSIVEQITSNKDKNITSYNLEKMEFWRRRATNASNDAYSSGNMSEGKALKEIVKSYDNFMGKLPKHALLSGDSTAVAAIDAARKTRRMQGVLFERNKVVKNLVNNNDLTNEELANIVLTGSKAAEKINKGAGGVIKNMKKTIPLEKQPEFINNLKRGTMSRVLNKSQGSELVDGVPMIMPNKLIKEVDNLLGNQTFMNELFDEGEQKMLTALRNDLVKINSVKAGADNYSNTAYAMMRFFDSIPYGGMGLASAASKLVAEPAGKLGAKKALNKNLTTVLHGAQKQFGGDARFSLLMMMENH